jgi:hypothetical protein
MNFLASSGKRPRKPQVFDPREAVIRDGPVSGLARDWRTAAFPRPKGPQWRMAILDLDYRCGGSAGFSPASRASDRCRESYAKGPILARNDFQKHRLCIDESSIFQ